MASNATVPNSFTDGTATSAPAMNANFTAILNWVNTNAVHLDGTKAFTAVPSGPATDPTTANQLTRKAYVDAKVWATANYADASVTTAKIVDGNVTTPKIADGAITSAKIADGTIVTGDIADGAITSAKILDGTIATGDLADGAVTSAKIADDTIVNADLASGKFTKVRGIQASDYCFRAIRSGVGAISHNTNTVLVFDSETYDYNSNYNPVNGHYTVPTAGVYHFDATVAWDAGSVGVRQIEVRRYNSGGTFQEIIAQNVVSAGDVGTDFTVNNASGDTLCAANDIIRVHVLQTSGGGLNVDASASVGCFFNGHCIRITT